jgi:hypothetical protein
MDVNLTPASIPTVLGVETEKTVITPSPTVKSNSVDSFKPAKLTSKEIIEKIVNKDFEGVSEEFIKSVKDELEKIPLPILRALHDNGWEVQIKHHMSQNRPDKVTTTDGIKYDSVLGHVDGAGKKVMIPEYNLPSGRKELEKISITNPNVIDDVVRHEIGHAIDRIIGKSYANGLRKRIATEKLSSEEIKDLNQTIEKIEKNGICRLDSHVEGIFMSEMGEYFSVEKEIPKELKHFVNPTESLAQAFNYLLGKEDEVRDKKLFEQYFPETIKFAKKLLNDEFKLNI